eukprot:2039993-Alexandrium_andersonii.AAC.1
MSCAWFTGESHLLGQIRAQLPSCKRSPCWARRPGAVPLCSAAAEGVWSAVVADSDLAFFADSHFARQLYEEKRSSGQPRSKLSRGMQWG